VDNADNVEITINPSVVFVTKDEFDDAIDEINEDIGEINQNLNQKANKQEIQVKTFTIPTSSWTLNSTTNLYEATITDTTVNSYDNADISFDAATYDIASDAGIKGYVTEIQSTGIKLFADSVPSASVSGKYNVERGVANG